MNLEESPPPSRTYEYLCYYIQPEQLSSSGCCIVCTIPRGILDDVIHCRPHGRQPWLPTTHLDNFPHPLSIHMVQPVGRDFLDRERGYRPAVCNIIQLSYSIIIIIKLDVKIIVQIGCVIKWQKM
jgi:hypothetical protein